MQEEKGILGVTGTPLSLPDKVHRVWYTPTHNVDANGNLIDAKLKYCLQQPSDSIVSVVKGQGFSRSIEATRIACVLMGSTLVFKGQKFLVFDVERDVEPIENSLRFITED